MFGFLKIFKFLNHPGWAVGITFASIVIIAMVKSGANPSPQPQFANSVPTVTIKLPKDRSERYRALMGIGTGIIASVYRN